MRRMYMAGVATGFLNGLLGAGGGMVMLLFLKRGTDLPAHKAHATSLAIMLPLSVLSACVYAGSTQISWQTALWLCLGGMAGGFAGARLLKRVKPRYLGKVLGAVLIFSAVRMVLG
ncbi:MAG: TSUP family transporter [Defluviitaleaceae bacterium]|nr:TSUP family transporter [Defluviitaleaceae bacterium]